MRARVDRLQRERVVEVDVGDHGNGRPRDDRLGSATTSLSRGTATRTSSQPASTMRAICASCRLDVARVRLRHRLHDDRRPAADRDAAYPDLALGGHTAMLSGGRGCPGSLTTCVAARTRDRIAAGPRRCRDTGAGPGHDRLRDRMGARRRAAGSARDPGSGADRRRPHADVPHDRSVRPRGRGHARAVGSDAASWCPWPLPVRAQPDDRRGAVGGIGRGGPVRVARRCSCGAATFFALNAVWFPLVEEPGLVQRFGEDYENYGRHVPRWLPRRTPWTPSP